MLRKEQYKKDRGLEHVLSRMNDQLYSLENDLVSSFDCPKLPTIFIIGLQRSGTTILMQLLINSYFLTYPNNLLARFWKSPFIGANISKSISSRFNSNMTDLSSDLGYTKGWSGPHEFSYFWRQWFPYEIYENCSKQEMVNEDLFIRTIAALESVYSQPLAVKNITICDLYIDALARILPKSIFLNIERNPLYTAQSTYESRMKLYGDENAWIGVKPKDYEKIKEYSFEDQIASQIFSVKQAIHSSLEKLDQNRYLNISYEELIKEPHLILSKIENIVGESGFKLIERNNNIPQLQSSNSQRLGDVLFDRLSYAIDKAREIYRNI